MKYFITCVLIISSMATLPFLGQRLDVELAEATPGSHQQTEYSPIITIESTGDDLLENSESVRSVLHQRLVTCGDEEKKEPIYLKANKEVDYSTVVAIMTDIKAAGFDRLVMVSEPKEKIN